MRKFLKIAALIIAVMLGWGYWHASTHASIYISINDAAKQDLPFEVFFLDAAGRPLAQARTAGPYKIIALIHPQAGECVTKSTAAYQDCFAIHSTWIPTWAGNVRFATLTLPNCRIERAPVRVHEYGDAWVLWWVPLPHVGGKPYSYFDFTINVDTKFCK